MVTYPSLDQHHFGAITRSPLGTRAAATAPAHDVVAVEAYAGAAVGAQIRVEATVAVCPNIVHQLTTVHTRKRIVNSVHAGCRRE